MTPTKEGILSALKNDAGAVPNEPLTQPARPKRPARLRFDKLSGRVVQVRPPVLGFSCDDCGFPSYGWRAMSRHVDETGHRKYTADLP